MPVSTVTGEGVAVLREELSDRVGVHERECLFRLSYRGGRLLSYLQEHGNLEEVEYGHVEVTVWAHLGAEVVALGQSLHRDRSLSDKPLVIGNGFLRNRGLLKRFIEVSHAQDFHSAMAVECSSSRRRRGRGHGRDAPSPRRALGAPGDGPG